MIYRTILLAVLLCLAWASGANAAGGAFAVDDSDIAAPGECRVETWLSGAENSDRSMVVAPVCTFAAFTREEIGLQANRHRDLKVYDTDIGPKAKILLIPSAGSPFGLAVSGAASFSARRDRLSSATVNVPLTFAIDDAVRVNLNGGWLRETLVPRSFATWGAGAEWKVAPEITLIGETFGRDAGAPRWQAGPRFGLADGKIDIDLIAGRNISGARTNWLTLGTTARF